MCDEIEEGELNSDLDEDLKACQKEAHISGEQQNPYDEEDVSEFCVTYYAPVELWWINEASLFT